MNTWKIMPRSGGIGCGKKKLGERCYWLVGTGRSRPLLVLCAELPLDGPYGGVKKG